MTNMQFALLLLAPIPVWEACSWIKRRRRR